MLDLFLHSTRDHNILQKAHQSLLTKPRYCCNVALKMLLRLNMLVSVHLLLSVPLTIFRWNFSYIQKTKSKIIFQKLKMDPFLTMVTKQMVDLFFPLFSCSKPKMDSLDLFFEENISLELISKRTKNKDENKNCT